MELRNVEIYLFELANSLAKRTHNEYDLDSIARGVVEQSYDGLHPRDSHPGHPSPIPRQNDQNKVKALMQSISEMGLQEPIDVLEVDGQYFGFSSCHRHEACNRLGYETIRCQVRRAPHSVLRMHLA